MEEICQRVACNLLSKQKAFEVFVPLLEFCKKLETLDFLKAFVSYAKMYTIF